MKLIWTIKDEIIDVSDTELYEFASTLDECSRKINDMPGTQYGLERFGNSVRVYRRAGKSYVSIGLFTWGMSKQEAQAKYA